MPSNKVYMSPVEEKASKSNAIIANFLKNS